HRARRFGARPAITPSATIVHYGGASDRDFVEKRIKMFKGKVTLMGRYFSSINYQFGRALHLLVPLIRWWTFSVAARMSNRLEFYRLADNWRSIWRRRKEWSRGYKLTG